MHPTLCLLFFLLPILCTCAENHCLSQNAGTGSENYRICCPNSDASSVEEVEGVKYRYRCESFSGGAEPSASNAVNARDCARHCSDSNSCTMGTWDSAYKKCYLSRNKDTDSIQSFRNFLVLEKIKQDKRPDPDTPGPGHVSVNELSNQGIANLCPSYGNKRFLTTDSGGTKHEWEILCSYVCDASTWLFNYQVPCPIGNAVDLVKQYHSRSDYTGFWFNQFGCNQQLPRPFGPSQATCFYNPAWWTHGWVHRTRTFSS